MFSLNYTLLVEPLAQTWHIILHMQKIKAPKYTFTTAVHVLLGVNTYSSIVYIYKIHVPFLVFFFDLPGHS